MNIKTKLLTFVIAAATLTAAGCGSSSESPFSPGGGASSGTNIPSQKNFVVLFDEPNPPVITDDGLDGGVEVEVSINAADRLDLATTGATAYLEVDWGTLSATSCQIQSSGSCTITWISNSNFDPEFFPADEQITFTAWILGEESYADVNGNGVFDDGDVFTNDSDGPFLDLNHDGGYTAGTDQILYPGNAAGSLTPANGLFDGPDCAHSTLCSGASAIYISDRAILSIREAP